MSWEQLERRLALTFAAAERGLCAVIRDPHNPALFVQFWVFDDLTCLTLQLQGPGRHHASDDLWATAEADGFVFDPVAGVHTRDVDLPLDTDGIRALAHRTMWALRDLFAVPSPDVLEYQAWRDPVDITVPGAGHRGRIPGADPRRLPWLGLPLGEDPRD